MRGPVRAGFGASEITPPPGVDLTGYGFYRDRRLERVLDPLYARCLLLDDGTARLAIVSCDLVGLTIPFADDVRRRIAAACGMEVEQVMLACTHTHSGPATADLLGIGVVDGAYMARLPGLIVEACEAAVADLAPAEVGWAIDEVEPIGYCRLPEEPADYEDPKLGVLVCRRAKGDVGFVQYACHAVTLGVNRECSADYPGAVVRVVRSHGVEALFLTGPAGDIDPLVNKVEWASGTPEDVEGYGRQLGARAAELMAQVECPAGVALGAGEGRIGLPVRVPDEAAVLEALAEARERFDQTREPADRFEAEASERALAKVRSGRALDAVEFVVQVLRIGELRLVGLSGEVYSGVGPAVARAAGGPAMVVAQANGALGYIPDEASLAAGDDYGSSAAAKIYGHFPLEPEAPRRIVEAVKSLAE
jgi:hypothetical protein